MPLAKGVVNLLGIGTEAYAHHKQKKEAANQASTTSLKPPEVGRRLSTSSSIGVVEEDDWLRDEAQEQLEDEIAVRVPTTAPVIDPSLSKGLPYPVILPQRRPESKAHGFVRAYAPDLAGCGINQTTWLKFLTDFEESIKVRSDS